MVHDMPIRNYLATKALRHQVYNKFMSILVLVIVTL
jgi:hypothetical protein